MSPTLVAVLHAVADGVAYGFDVIDRTGLPSGTVYPALSRLERDGYLRSSWEAEAEAFAAGRPARRYYRTTAAGPARAARGGRRLSGPAPGAAGSGPGAGMTRPVALPLPGRVLLGAAERLVPADIRGDWRREWDAEMAWRLRDGRPCRPRIRRVDGPGRRRRRACRLAQVGPMETRDVDLRPAYRRPHAPSPAGVPRPGGADARPRHRRHRCHLRRRARRAAAPAAVPGARAAGRRDHDQCRRAGAPAPTRRRPTSSTGPASSARCRRWRRSPPTRWRSAGRRRPPNRCRAPP